MSSLSRISSLIESELDELRLVLLEVGEEEIKPYVDEIATKANGTNKEELIKIEPFKIFLTYFYLTNNIILSFDEVYQMVLEIRDNINSWDYKTAGPLLLGLSKVLDDSGKVMDSKAYDYMTSLKLTPEFINYNLKPICFIMFDFLSLKRDIININLKNKGLGSNQALIRQTYNKSTLKNIIMVAVNALKEANDEMAERKEIAREKIKYTKEVQAMVDDASILQLDDMPDLWHRYLEVPLLEELYNIIFDNLNKKEHEIQDQIDEKEKVINRSPLVKYLFTNGIDINSLDSDLISNLEKISLTEDIVNILDFLRSLGLSLDEIFIDYRDILVSLTDEKVSKIKFLLTTKILSKKTLRDNLDLLGKRYNELLVNYEILKPIIDFNNIFYDDRILLKSSNSIKNILSILALYDLTRNNYIYLLCHFEFIDIYDLLLENDIPLHLFISICESENPLMTIKRILIYREIGEEFETGGKLLRKEVAIGSKCLVADDALDEYLPDFACLEKIKGNKVTKVIDDELVKDFDYNYRYSHDTYMIGSALISRPKFLRNYEAMNKDNVVACLVSNSLLSEKEFWEIVKEVKGKRLS